MRVKGSGISVDVPRFSSRCTTLTSSVELARHEAENSNRSECVATFGRGVQCPYDGLRDITSDLSGFDRVIGGPLQHLRAQQCLG